MASNKIEQNGISRRDFTSRVGAAAAGIAVGGDLFGSTVQAAADVGGRVLGANDRVVVASIGIRGQGNSLKRGFARLANVEVKTLCDIDANLAPERINDARLKDVATFKPGVRPGSAPRARRQGHRRGHHRHAESLARSRHHLGAAGGQTRVRREAGVAHGIGRPQDGRGGRALQQDRAGRHDEPEPPGRPRGDQVPARWRHRQGVHGARPLLQAAAGDRQVPRRPDGAGREVRADTSGPTNYEPTYDEQYLSKVDYDLWLGPAAKRPFNRNRFHYNWHWHWDYGNGDTGNQGPHQFDIARWGLNKQEHPVTHQLDRRLFRAGGIAGNAGHADRVVRLRRRHDPRVRDARRVHERRGHASGSATCSTVRRAGCGSTATAASGSRTCGPKNEKGPGADVPDTNRAGSDPLVLTSIEYPHYQNFVDAIRANDPKILTCDIDGRAPVVRRCRTWRTSPIATGHALVFDGKTETFVDDKKADQLLTREYRKGFELPTSFS